MLKKLIKYDMKSLNHLLIIIHVFLMIVITAGCILTRQIDYNSSEISQMFFIIAFLLFFTFTVSSSFGTQIIIAVRFYKNMFSDEGYLTNTLPVTKGQLLLSKTIAGSIWYFINTLLVYVCLFLLVAVPDVTATISAHSNEVLTELGFSDTNSLLRFFLTILLLSLISGICNTVTIYTAIIIGQLFRNHRVLGSVASFFGLSTVISFISLIGIVATGAFTKPMLAVQTGNDLIFYDYYMEIFAISIVLSIIVSIILYIISYVLLKKKINLN